MRSEDNRSLQETDAGPSERMVFAWEETASRVAEPRLPVPGNPHGRDSGLPGVKVRGAGSLRAVDRAFSRFDGWLDRYMPESLNPLARTGAIANTCLLVAVVSGILLLFWYSPSVRSAYDSLEALRDGSGLGQFVRSLHRYSSDACMLFILLHVVRVLVSLKFTGARSLAWVSGFVLMGVIWLIGWTGYWLVWDERGQQVALGTVRFFSFLPFLGDPLARSFLANDTVPSLLFFLVFFTHMLLPLAVAFLLWLHLSRVSRPNLLTGKALTFWILGTLVVLSVLMPAESAGRADLSSRPDGFEMDWWYLWPLVLTDRLGGGMLWAVTFVGALGLCGIPWWLAERSKEVSTARVDEDACQGCTLCSKDCPFDAIRMVERKGGGKGSGAMAVVDSDRCVSCGICTGACDSDAIALPGFEIPAEKESVAAWIRARREAGESAWVAYLCGEAAAGGLNVNPVTFTSPALPGYRTRKVPCAGWVGAPLIEFILQAGASGVLVVGCESGEARFREGGEWLEQRLAGKRKPVLRRRRADPERVLFLRGEGARPGKLAESAAAFRASLEKPSVRPAKRFAAVAVGGLLAGVLAVATWLGSDAPYRAPDTAPEIVVSFSHSGAFLEAERRLSSEELERLPAHMRAETASGGRRAPVRLRVTVDGSVLVDREYRPRGFRRDGPSTALETIEMPAESGYLRVQLNDSADPETWTHEWSGMIDFSARDRRVLLFEDGEFHLH